MMAASASVGRMSVGAAAWLCLLAAAAVVAVAAVEEDEDDDDISGPLMPMNGATMYDTRGLAEQRGFAGESAQVTTDDGYVLTLFRVRQRKEAASAASPPRPPVLLVHGLLLSSDAWLTDEGALPLVLGRAGYDVWLANVRGNAYSRRHLTLRPDADPAFWHYCWDEIGTRDVPALVDHVLKVTGSDSLHYVGHSLGATVGLVMCSRLPLYNAKLRSFAAMAPAVYLSKLVDMAGPDGMVHDMAQTFFDNLKALGKNEVFPRSDTAGAGAGQNGSITCADLADFRDMCEEKEAEGRALLGGPYLPAGTSWRMVECFKQAVDGGGVVGRYDHGTLEANIKAYGGNGTPPAYDFGNVTVPFTFYSTEFDQLVQPKDVDDLKAQLKNVVGDVRIKEPECFDHVTFLTARQKSCLPARSKLYQDIVAALNKTDATATT